MTELKADIIIIGGGVGGVACALAASEMGFSTILTEENVWIGGQLTSQAVPPDENRWIESFGCTARYQEFRRRVRAFYARNYPLTAEARGERHLNPGNAGVSRVSHEPRVALHVLYEMLAPFYHSGRLQILTEHRVIAAETDHDTVRSVTLVRTSDQHRISVSGHYFVDATELGDLLPLTHTEYVVGAEAQSETGELHASSKANPLNMQSITMVFALDYRPGEHHLIAKPQQYAFWRDYVPALSPEWSGRLFSWLHPVPTTLKPRTRVLFGPHDSAQDRDPEHASLWRYRRIADQHNFVPGTYLSDLTVVNWPQTDYFLGPIIEVSNAEAAEHLQAARELSLSFLYWLQTEAPHPDSDALGYPGLRLRPDVVGTDDGLAQYPYIREARRIRARFTVTEQHVGREMRTEDSATWFTDSVGIGHYNIDLHPSTGGDNYIDVPSLPFQIPLGSLIPIRMTNLLPASKNIGTTHITNGCYRLHPVEWNIGEAVGHLAGYCLQHHHTPNQVWETPDLLTEFQRLLEGEGLELQWPRIGPR